SGGGVARRRGRGFARRLSRRLARSAGRGLARSRGGGFSGSLGRGLAGRGGGGVAGRRRGGGGRDRGVLEDDDGLVAGLELQPCLDLGARYGNCFDFFVGFLVLRQSDPRPRFSLSNPKGAVT